MRLFTRFFLILLAFALMPVVLLGVWFLRSNERLRENAGQMHGQLASLASDMAEASVSDLNRALNFAEELRASHGKGASEPLRVLQRAALTHPSFILLSILDGSGTETLRIADDRLFPDREHSKRGDDPAVRKAMESGRVAVSPPFLQGDTPAVAVAYPLREGSCLYAVYSMAPLWRRIAAMRVGQSGRMLLLDASGRPLPGFEQVFPELKGLRPKGPSAWLPHIPSGSGALVGAYALCPSLGWYAQSLQPQEEALAVGERFLFNAFLMLFAITLLVTVGAYWITGRLTRPLQSLIGAARRVSRSEFGQSVPELGWGELNLLSQSFNEMMRTLKSYQELQVERIFEEKAKVDALVHTIPDGIVLASFDGEILYMNAAARSLLTAEEGDTQPRGRVVHEVLREPSLRKTALSLMRREKRMESSEVELRSAQNKRLGVFLCRAVTVLRENREIGILILLRDVTAERDLDRMKEEFFHSIVHDLRGPLGTIDGFVQLLKDHTALGEKEKLYIGYVEGSCERLRQLVSDILETAKMESGQTRLRVVPVAVPELIRRVRDLYALQAERRGIELSFAAAETPELEGDKELLERLLMNLIGNALKFTPRGGRIGVGVAPATGGEIEFSIQDTGPGIPQDKLQAVFEKFKQLDQGATARSGYGLGLAICRKIVELHGGRIWAESEQGQGARFVFRLPIKQRERA